MRLPVHEVFHSWQGEGCHMGHSAFFIRLFGCPIQCPWCDSAGTWHPDFIPERIQKLEVEALAKMASEARPEFVVITGGEPTIHNLEPLTNALNKKGLKVHLETSGAFPIRGQFDWVTVSPKWQKQPLEASLETADEYKLIVESPDSIKAWEEAAGSYFKEKTVWLHPEWSKREDTPVLKSITEWIKAHGSPYRAGWQIHKHYKADAHDVRAQADASLAL